MSKGFVMFGVFYSALSAVIMATFCPSPANVLPLPIDSDTINIGDDCVIKFDRQRKCPRWVFERLTHADVTGTANRTDNFFEPNDVPLEFRPLLQAYRNSGYDRGHAAPAADFRSDQAAMNESFSLANVFPQDASLNRGLWADFEHKIRLHVTGTDSIVYVVTVPIWQASGNASKIAYSVIGRNPIHCPTHVGKSLLVAKGDGFLMQSWVVPNEKPKAGAKIDDFRVTTDDFERAAGIDVWSHLADDVGRKLEAAK